MKNPSVCLISCYSGTLPVYFDLFIKSCSANSNINFLIVSDSIYRNSIPENVSFLSMSLEDIANLASSSFGFKVNISHAYKLNDFKPAYGDIFSDYITEYEFWGYIDIDIIFGNIKDFIVPILLEGYDTISVRAEYMTGFFSIFRNNSFITKLYTLSKDYKAIYEKNEYCGFDECNFLWVPLNAGAFILDYNTGINAFQSITHVVKKAEIDGMLKPYFDTTAIEEIYSQKITWDQSSMSISEFEVILYHLILLKKMPYAKFPKWNKVPDKYFIVNTKFIRGDINNALQALLIFYNNSRIKFIYTKKNLLFKFRYIYGKFLRKRANAYDNMIGTYLFEHQKITLHMLADSLIAEYYSVPAQDGSDQHYNTSVLFEFGNNKFISLLNRFYLEYILNEGIPFIRMTYINYNFNCDFKKIAN